ncbi:MAG: ATP-binding protein [Microcoleaceae cyanobacterium]
MSEAIAKNREQADIVFARLQTNKLLSKPKRLQKIESAYQTYVIAVDKLLELLKAERFQEALEVDENEVDPSFEKLHDILLAQSLLVANRALNFKRWAFFGTQGIGLFLIIIIGIFFWQYRKANQKVQRIIAESANRREQLLQQEQQILEEKIAERTQALQNTNMKLEKVLTELKHSQLQLIKSEKMASIGQLTAGIAHEINNPLGFISGNLTFTDDYIQDLIELLELYQTEWLSPSEKILNKVEDIELDYLIEDLPKSINSMKQGMKRITEISTSMRTFSRADTVAKVPFNLHEGIDSTLLILKHRLKANEQRPEIEVVKNYGNLPEVNCYPGQLNQVFMNLIANAIDALEESNLGKSFEEIKAVQTRITITTEIDNENQQIIIRIRDNGMGMSKSVKEKVFEHLFTTKGVGKGTGLGLSISRQIVEEKHGGTLTCNSALEKGTEFVIALPRY